MEYNAFERWVESNEREFVNDLRRIQIQKLTVSLLLIFMVILMYLFYFTDTIKELSLLWSIILLSIIVIVFPTIMTLTNGKLKFGQFTSILLMNIANEIQIYQPKEKNKLLNYLKLLNKNFKPKKSKNEDFTPYEKYIEIQRKFEDNMYLLSKHLYHAMKNEQIKNINTIQIKLLANNIFNQDVSMYSQVEEILKVYPYWDEIPKKYDFIKKFPLPKNQWVILFIWEMILIGSLYILQLIFKLDRDTLFIGFFTLTGIIAYIIFKK